MRRIASGSGDGAEGGGFEGRADQTVGAGGHASAGAEGGEFGNGLREALPGDVLPVEAGENGDGEDFERRRSAAFDGGADDRNAPMDGQEMSTPLEAITAVARFTVSAMS